MKRSKLLVGFLFVCFLLTRSFSLAAELKPVEPEIRKEFEKAKKLLPKAVLARMGDVKLERKQDLGIGKDAPLEYRLLNRAAYASFSVLDRVITVYDAGAEGKPHWIDPAPGAEEVARFLAKVADVLEVKPPSGKDDPALKEAWKAFTTKVYSWGEKELPNPIPPVGAPVVWNQFLQQGVWRAMGGKVERVPMLVHEFAHALQLESGLSSMSSRMKSWAALSGFVETSNGEATDGFAGGRNKTEDAMVLIRFLLADDAAEVKRGASADYDVAKNASFVNRYARYDLREDYAESFRLMVSEPERLAKMAPEKFLYLNALGWNARLDLKNPGPLWYSGEEFDRLIPKPMRRKAFEQLLGRDGAGLGLPMKALAAVLRAHAEELNAEDLPEPLPQMELPKDLPTELKAIFESPHLQVTIDGKRYPGGSSDQMEKMDEAISRWMSLYEFEIGITKLFIQGTKGVKGVYAEVTKTKGVTKRESRYETLRESAWSLLSADDWKKMDANEAKFHKAQKNKAPALRYELLSSKKKNLELLKELNASLNDFPSEYDRARLTRTGVDLLLRNGDMEAVRTQIQKIPGETLGKWMRVKSYLKAANTFEKESEKSVLIEAAKKEIENCQSPKIKKQLNLLDLE